jgi:hypothetical protein
MSQHRYHIDSNDMPSFPPADWAPAQSDDWDDWDNDEGPMHISAIAILSMLGWLVGIGMGWLIWS